MGFIVMLIVGLQPSMPHPQHDPVVIHFVLVVLATSVVLKLVTFVWVFFPSMTGLYPVVGVSLTSGAAPYHFAEASAFLANLDTELEKRNPGATDVLERSWY